MKQITSYLKIDVILWVLLIQLCILFGFLRPLGIAITLSNFGIFLLILSTVSITIAGQLIMALYSNRRIASLPNSSEKKIFNVFMVSTVVGVAIGFYLSNLIQKPVFITIYLVISVLFYVYATYLKSLPLIKNITIAFTVSIVILNVGFFDLLPAITKQNETAQRTVFTILLDYALLIFVLTLIYELLQDYKYLEADTRNGIRTLPVILKNTVSIKIISSLFLLPIAMISYYLYTYFFSRTWVLIGVLLFIIAPLMLAAILLLDKKDVRSLSKSVILLKFAFVSVTLTFILYPYLIL